MKVFNAVLVFWLLAVASCWPVEKELQNTLESVDAHTRGDAGGKQERSGRSFGLTAGINKFGGIGFGLDGHGGYGGFGGYGGYPGVIPVGYVGYPAGFGGYGVYPGQFGGYGGYPVVYGGYNGFGGGFNSASASSSASSFGYGFGK